MTWMYVFGEERYGLVRAEEELAGLRASWGWKARDLGWVADLSYSLSPLDLHTFTQIIAPISTDSLVNIISLWHAWAEPPTPSREIVYHSNWEEAVPLSPTFHAIRDGEFYWEQGALRVMLLTSVQVVVHWHRLLGVPCVWLKSSVPGSLLCLTATVGVEMLRWQWEIWTCQIFSLWCCSVNILKAFEKGFKRLYWSISPGTCAGSPAARLGKSATDRGNSILGTPAKSSFGEKRSQLPGLNMFVN